MKPEQMSLTSESTTQLNLEFNTPNECFYNNIM
jgi:hypothetical protein